MKIIRLDYFFKYIKQNKYEMFSVDSKAIWQGTELSNPFLAILKTQRPPTFLSKCLDDLHRVSQLLMPYVVNFVLYYDYD